MSKRLLLFLVPLCVAAFSPLQTTRSQKPALTDSERRGKEIYMSLSSDILFTSGSAALQPGAQDKLREIAGIMQQYPRTMIEIVGHTDSVGSESMNQVLSERRADSVKTYLTGQGLTSTSITAKGFGEDHPVASNDTAEGRQQNRRVELVVSGDLIGTTAD